MIDTQILRELVGSPSTRGEQFEELLKAIEFIENRQAVVTLVIKRKGEPELTKHTLKEIGDIPLNTLQDATITGSFWEMVWGDNFQLFDHYSDLDVYAKEMGIVL